MTMERDERLSALLDGALAPAEEAALRAELARDPALAAQYEELARVDAALRALPARPVPADLRARLQTKIAAEARAAASIAAPEKASPARGAPPARASRRSAWLAGFSAAAAAAAAALLFVVGGPGPQPSDATRLANQTSTGTEPGPANSSPGDAATTEPVDAPDALDSVATSSPNEDGLLDELDSMSADGGSPNPSALAESLAAVPVDPEESLLEESLADEVEALEADSAVAMLAEANRGGAGSVGAVREGEAAGPMAASALADGSSADGSSADATRLASAAATPQAAPVLWVEATDDEAAALEELAPADAGVVAVLDWLGELDELEAEAS